MVKIVIIQEENEIEENFAFVSSKKFRDKLSDPQSIVMGPRAMTPTGRQVAMGPSREVAIKEYDHGGISISLMKLSPFGMFNQVAIKEYDHGGISISLMKLSPFGMFDHIVEI
ncbi:hypothetical protein FCV25MIE_10343 [Fagus crenata]